MASEQPWKDEPVATWVQFYGLLVAPVAWAVRLVTGYPLVEFVCANDMLWLLHALSAAALLLGLTGVWAAYITFSAGRDRARERAHGHQVLDANVVARTYFMGVLGLMVSILSIAVIVVEWMSVIFTSSPCLTR
jgi:hypothetical protein